MYQYWYYNFNIKVYAYFLFYNIYISKKFRQITKLMSQIAWNATRIYHPNAIDRIIYIYSVQL